MKVGDWVRLRDIAEHKQEYWKQYLGMIGQVIDEQHTVDKRLHFVRVSFGVELGYIDMAAWRIENFLSPGESA